MSHNSAEEINQFCRKKKDCHFYKSMFVRVASYSFPREDFLLNKNKIFAFSLLLLTKIE